MQRNGRTNGFWAVVAVVAVMALGLPAITATAQGAPAGSAGLTTNSVGANAAASQQWAYGGAKWVNTSVQLGNTSYSSHAFFGWQVIVTATNTTLGTVALEAQRTMAASLFATYCEPNCTHPSTAGNLSIQGSESDAGFANLTGLATVYVNGTAVPAVGLDNASSQGSANLNESYSLTLGGHTATGRLSVIGHANTQVAFSPSLGLVPWNLSQGLQWNSSASYSASGAWGASYSYAVTSLLGTTSSGSGAPSGNVSGTGTVALQGADLGPITLSNGMTVPAIVLAISGPFDNIEGVILVPHGYEVFGSGHHDWDGHALGAEAVTTSRLDVAVDAAHHRLQVVASASTYAGSDASLSSASTVTAAGPGGSAPPSTALVQGQPETVTQAQHAASCLRSSCSGSSGAASSIVTLLVVGLVAVVIVGTVGVVEYRAWARRHSQGQLVGGYSQQVAGSQGLPPPPPQGPTPPMPPSGGA
ncbi:MAG: hypothetical protein L3K18_01155 [Thermoplasmata archaeon]|nr:hypothetical protein [Thermoplasmata archaeon]MCI4355737.1 hypothetical protein [Thermoplasmata archaeon]